MQNHLTSRNLLFLSFIISLCFYFYLVVKADFLYMQYDAYYYSAVADGFVDDGSWSNKVTSPPSNLRTPQNGIIVLNALLKNLGANDIESRLEILAFANVIFISLISFFCYKLFILAEIPITASWILSLTIPVSFYYQTVYLQPTNDAIFVLLSLFTLFYIFTHEKLTGKDIVFLFVLATFVPFFRLTGVALFIAPSLVFLMLKKYRGCLLFALLAVWGFLSPFILNYILGFEISNMQSRSSEIVGSYSLDYFLQHFYNTITLNIPEALLRFTYFTMGFTIQNAITGIAISIIVIIFFIFTSKKAIAEKNPIMLVLIFYALINLVMFQMHPAQPTRYLLALSPLIPIIFFLKGYEKYFRTIATAIFSVALLISTAGILANDKPAIAKQKKAFSEQIKKYTEKQDYVLLSYFPRVSYFLLNKSAAKTLNHAVKSKPKNLLILGQKDYLTYIINELNKKQIEIKIQLIPLSYIDYQKSDKPSFESIYEPVVIHAILAELSYH